MNDVKVMDPEQAIDDCNYINERSQKLYNTAEILNTNLIRIENDWESNGLDKESYVTELKKQIENIFLLCKAIRNVTNPIIYYAENAKEISSKNMEER